MADDQTPATPVTPVAPAATSPSEATPTAPAPSQVQPVTPAAADPTPPAASTPAEPAAAPEPAPGAAPAVEPAAAPSAAPVDAAATPTLLESVGEKPKDTKPTEPAAPPEGAKAEPKAADPAKAVEAPPEPIKYELKFPEAVRVDQEQVTQLTSLLNDSRFPAEKAQQLVDLHVKSLEDFANKYAAQALQNQQKVFADTRANWRKEVLSDSEIGGAGHQTAMKAIARVRDILVRPEERASFDRFCLYTGAGDNPAMLRMMYRMAAILDEPAAPAPGTKPPPDIGKPQSRRLRDHYTNGRGA